MGGVIVNSTVARSGPHVETRQAPAHSSWSAGSANWICPPVRRHAIKASSLGVKPMQRRQRAVGDEPFIVQSLRAKRAR
jgi:hypothetical protein